MYLFPSSCDCAGDNTITAEEELTDPIKNQNKRIVRILVNSNKGFNSASVNIMQSSFSSFIRIWAEFAEQRDCLSINTEQYNRNWKSQSYLPLLYHHPSGTSSSSRNIPTVIVGGREKMQILQGYEAIQSLFCLSQTNQFRISFFGLSLLLRIHIPSIVEAAFRKPNNNDP